jgi:hypothetical protein
MVEPEQRSVRAEVPQRLVVNLDRPRLTGSEEHALAWADVPTRALVAGDPCAAAQRQHHMLVVSRDDHTTRTTQGAGRAGSVTRHPIPGAEVLHLLDEGVQPMADGSLIPRLEDLHEPILVLRATPWLPILRKRCMDTVVFVGSQRKWFERRYRPGRLVSGD